MSDTGPVAVKGRAGQPIDLPLTQGPATGYSWQLDLPEGVTRLEDGSSRPAPPDQRLGATSGAVLRVKAAKPGRYRVIAQLARPWDPNAPLQTLVLDLTVE